MKKDKLTPRAEEINETVDSVSERTEKSRIYTKAPFIAALSVAAVVLIFWIIIGITVLTTGQSLREIFGLPKKRLDYVNGELDKYITLEDSDYKGYEISLDIRKPTKELDVKQKIIELIAKNRGGMLNDYKYQYDVLINPGDRVFIYYAGYELDGNGKRHEIASLTNYNSAAATQLTVGSGDFPPGFELALIGEKPVAIPEFKIASGGYVSEGDVVYATATYVTEDGILHYDESIRIDLNEENYEDKWGAGVLPYLQEKSMGLVNSSPIILNSASGKIYYTDLTVNYVTKFEDDGKPIVASVTYPYDYEDEALRNKTVYFDIFVEKVMCYESHEFDDNFITDVLKVSAEELSEFEGNSLSEKYENYLYLELLSEYEENCRAEAEVKVFEYLMENLEYTVPEFEYDARYSEYYDKFVSEVTLENEEGTSSYASVDDYIRAYYGLDEEVDVGAFLRKTVRDEVSEKLILFAIARREGILPTGDEANEIYRASLKEEFEYYYGKTEADYESSEAYQKALDAYEQMINEYYGEDQCRYLLVYYESVIDDIINMANIVTK